MHPTLIRDDFCREACQKWNIHAREFYGYENKVHISPDDGLVSVYYVYNDPSIIESIMGANISSSIYPSIEKWHEKINQLMRKLEAKAWVGSQMPVDHLQAPLYWRTLPLPHDCRTTSTCIASTTIGLQFELLPLTINYQLAWKYYEPMPVKYYIFYYEKTYKRTL